MRFRKREPLLSVLLDLDFNYLTRSVNGCQTISTTSRTGSGTDMAPRPNASAVLRTLFAAKKIRTYLGRLVRCSSELALV